MVDGKPQSKPYPSVVTPMYTGYYRDVAEALDGKRDAPVTAEDGRDLLRIIEAAIQSSKEEKSIRL